MKLRHELSYDASLDDVVAMLTNPEYWDRVAQATNALSSKATVDDSGAAITVVVDQEQEVVGVPSFAKKFVGDSTRAIKTMIWRGAAATFEVETPGKPTHITGTATVSGSGSGATLVYDLEVKASVPLVGGKLEKLVAELTSAGFDQEGAAGEAWLRGER